MLAEPSLLSAQSRHEAAGAPAACSALRWDVITDDRALAELEPEWRRLLAVTPLASGFQSFAWVAACRAALGAPRTRVFALVVRDGVETVGILPTELDLGGRLSLIGEGVSNYLGPVYQPERLDSVVRALAACLEAERRVTLVDFQGLREGSPFVAAMCGLPLCGWSEGRIVQTATCPVVDLSAGWDALHSRRKSKQRSNDTRKWKALARLGDLEFVEAADPHAVEAALPTMFRLFRERWSGRYESAGFAARFRSFHERAAPVLAAAGHLNLSLLKLDGEIVAFSYGVRAGGVTSSYVLAHDDRIGVCSPGLLLLIRVLEAAAKRGDPEYDFSLGEETYKSAWATGTRGVFRVLRWRRRSAAAVKGRLQAFGSRAWVAARSVGWLRAIRRNRLRRLAAGNGEKPAWPRLSAPATGAWNVHRVTHRATGTGAVARAATFAEMTRHLSPRLFVLAADRCFRGDTLLMLFAGERLLGVIWRAARARRALVTGGWDLGDTETVYYHPIAAAGHQVRDVVQALAGTAEAAPGFIVVAREWLAGDGLRRLGAVAGARTFPARSRDP